MSRPPGWLVRVQRLRRLYGRRCAVDSVKRDLCRTIVDMAHRFCCAVVAEGIETHADLEALRELGCEQGQGYLLGRPMPKDDLIRRLAGEMPPSAGTVDRRGALGYLRQDPRQDRSDDATSGIEYLLAARGLVELQRGVEKARLRLEEHASEDRVARFARLEEEYERLGGYRADIVLVDGETAEVIKWYNSPALKSVLAAPDLERVYGGGRASRPLSSPPARSTHFGPGRRLP